MSNNKITVAKVMQNVCMAPDSPRGYLLQNGLVVDPVNHIEERTNIRMQGSCVVEVGTNLTPKKGEGVVDCSGAYVCPGLIDMHLHLGDLFDVSTNPTVRAVEHGVTLGLSPGAGNTFMAPALMGAEVDRGLPLHVGVFVGGAAALASGLNAVELAQVLRGEADKEVVGRLSKNPITCDTAPLLCGIKDHMGHFLQSDMAIDTLFETCQQVGLPYMSHTQSLSHAKKMVALSAGRNLHLGHATAAGGGENGQQNLSQIVELIGQNSHVSGEFVSSMILPAGGTRDGMVLGEAAKDVALQALADGVVDILVSDGQSGATMKGFGDTRDNIGAILYLANSGILSLKDAVATMTKNPAALLAKLYKNSYFTQKLGHLGVGALGNVTVINPKNATATYTFVSGNLASFEGKLVRRGYGSGGLVTRFGIVKNTGVGNLPAFEVEE